MNVVVSKRQDVDPSWRLPHSYVEEVGDIDFQIKLAKLAEKGKLDAFFLGG
jgi:hypothetical protein